MNRYLKFFTLIIIGVSFAFSGCEKKVNVSKLTLIPDKCVLKVEETIQLTAIVSPDNADDKSIRWNITTLWMTDTAAAPAVASISDNGKVKGLAEGWAIATGITNNMFCEASTEVFVGYAAAVDAAYSGTLQKNKDVISTAAQIAIRRTSEYEAQFFLHFVEKGFFCDVSVDYISGKLEFSGETTLESEDSTIPVKVSGSVTLDGLGGFTIIAGDDTYEFAGLKVPRTV